MRESVWNWMRTPSTFRWMRAKKSKVSRWKCSLVSRSQLKRKRLTKKRPKRTSKLLKKKKTSWKSKRTMKKTFQKLRILVIPWSALLVLTELNRVWRLLVVLVLLRRPNNRKKRKLNSKLSIWNKLNKLRKIRKWPQRFWQTSRTIWTCIEKLPSMVTQVFQMSKSSS